MLVSGAAASRGAVAEVIDAWLQRDEFVVITSDAILSDAERALATPYFARRLRAEDRALYLAKIRRAAFVVPVVSSVRGVASDPDDDAVIAAAIDGRAEYLVTGDAGLRAVSTYASVQFVTPREFIEVLRTISPGRRR